MVDLVDCKCHNATYEAILSHGMMLYDAQCAGAHRPLGTRRCTGWCERSLNETTYDHLLCSAWQRYCNPTLPEKASPHAWKAVEDGLENGVDHCEHAVSSSGSSSALDAHHALLHMLLLPIVSIVYIYIYHLLYRHIAHLQEMDGAVCSIHQKCWTTRFLHLR